MKKIVYFAFSIISAFQACTNKTTQQPEQNKIDTLVLKKRQPEKVNGDSEKVETDQYSRPTHAAHFSSNSPHYHNGNYHNGNY